MPSGSEEIEAAWAGYASGIATALRQARSKAGLSQEQTAYRSGLTRYTYQKYEKGESRPGRPANPSIRSLLAICQVLDVSLESVLPASVPDLRSR